MRFRHFNSHKAHLAHLLDGFVGKFAGFVELCRDRGYGVARKIARRVPDHAVLVTEGEQRIVHQASAEDYTVPTRAPRAGRMVPP